ncbi:flagellar assembly protein FliO [Thalassobaculum sp.]|uniref:flagellar assembly protein FliO n=1 Tax=Thalassobaculum sp. TaxID=2022740 RepID=UPI0032EDD967
MSILEYSQFAASLAFVLGLIGVFYALAHRYGSRRFGFGVGRGGPGTRLSVVEARAVDGRHRLVLVRRDDVEHLILIGPDRSLVVETGIREQLSFDRTLADTDDHEAEP